MKNIVYLDTSFTDTLRPKLLSLGMVTFDGHEHYVELDLGDPASAATVSQASDFARHCGVLQQWGRVPDSSANYAEMGRRTAHWLKAHAARLGQPAHVAFDNPLDFELLGHLLRAVGEWESVLKVIWPLDVEERFARFDGALVADAVCEQLRKRGLERHHALVDAHALRASWIAVNTGKRVRL